MYKKMMKIIGVSIPGVNLILVDWFVMVKIVLLNDHIVIVLLGLSFPGPDVSQTPVVVTPARQITITHICQFKPFVILGHLSL